RITQQNFDAFDRLFDKIDPKSKRIRYGYDANGNRTTVTDPDSIVTQYSYDELNRVSEVVNQEGVTEYKYDRSSLKTRVNYPNGSSTQQSYDQAGRVLSIDNNQGLVTISSFEYQYDDNGNRTQQIETNGATAETITYTFDDNDRLTTAAYATVTTEYDYDAAYNRTGEQTTDNANSTITVDKTYQYNNRNQITQATDNLNASHSASYAFDNNGNRISRTEGALVSTFIYDARDQIKEITSGGSSIGQFLYDYQGLRIRKQTQTETLRYVYDDQSVLIQTDDSGTTLSKYDYGPDRLLSLNNTTEGSQFYLFDALGSAVNLTKPDTSIQTRIQYDAWGNVRNQVGSSANSFGFTGHEMDEESGLIYMKARFYDPVLGMFLNEDSF
ncbi:MAG: hypothetical protein GY770_01305, partial [Aestuariibacter sp.]|nr:hypothetical protein [Aestuariibacter sp.]